MFGLAHSTLTTGTLRTAVPIMTGTNLKMTGTVRIVDAASQVRIPYTDIALNLPIIHTVVRVGGFFKMKII
jgi:hypothetical protein